MEMNIPQTLFTIFYAFAWGSISEVQPQWRLFDYAGIKLGGPQRRIRCRVLVAFLIVNIAPAFFFILVLILLGDQSFNRIQVTRFQPLWALVASVWALVAAITPALAHFGFYRLWLWQVETNPDRYYFPRYSGDSDELEYVCYPPSFRELNHAALHLLRDSKARRLNESRGH